MCDWEFKKCAETRHNCLALLEPQTISETPLKWQTRRERLKSALYLRLKKRKVFKIVKRGVSTFLKIQSVAKYQKN